jgi:hypothetical protein
VVIIPESIPAQRRKWMIKREEPRIPVLKQIRATASAAGNRVKRTKQPTQNPSSILRRRALPFFGSDTLAAAMD